MSRFLQFSGRPATTSIVNLFTQAGAATLATGSPPSAIATAVTTTTGGTLVSALSVTGAGDLTMLVVRTANATAKTLRVKVTIDGTVVCDVTSASTSTSGNGLIILGDISSAIVDAGVPARFNSSLLVEVCGSVSSDTNGINVYHKRIMN